MRFSEDSRMFTMKPVALALAIALLSGCTVGPKYVRPSSDIPTHFDQADQYADAEVRRPLWSAFRSPELDALLARADAHNTSIAQAQARLAETRALRGLTTFSKFPTVTAAADGERSRFSSDDPFAPPGSGITENYRAGFDASWEIDLFGGVRSQGRQIVRRAEADAAALQSVQLAIRAETAQAYFALRGAQQRLTLQNEILANLRESDRILEARLKEGRGNALELAQNRTLAFQVAAQVPEVEAEVVRQEQRLAVLTAQPVAALRQSLSTATALPDLPSLVQIGTPQEWIQRRPDVREAERRLAIAYADVGEAVAEYFPKLNLLGSFGWTAQTSSGLGDAASRRWSYGPSLSWSFLNVGRVRQQVKAAEARKDAATAAYQESVLLALEDTENALAQYRAANRSRIALGEALSNARKARDLAKLRYDNGASDFLALLDAERTRIDAEDADVQARAAQATALARLYKALAGDFAGASP